MAQSPQFYDSPFLYIPSVSRVWTTTGNTDTVSDASVVSTTQVVIMPTSAYAGRWYVSNITPTSSSTDSVTKVTTITPGSFTITSSSSETQTTTTYQYQLL